jgi:hypothetical protein
MNKLGQIVLDPHVTIPASQAWLFEDETLLASVDKGMRESNKGLSVNKGSFANFVDDP